MARPSLLLLTTALFSQPIEGSVGLRASGRGGRRLLHGLRAADAPAVLDGDTCFEARVKSPVLDRVAARKSAILDVYEYICDTCESGIHHLECATQAQFADTPRAWLDLCDHQMGPQPTSAAVICSMAKKVRDEVAPLAKDYKVLSKLMDMQKDNCLTLPLPCIILAEHCIGQPNVPYCFNECLRTGSMNHALFPEADSASAAKLVTEFPYTLSTTTTTTTAGQETTTTTTYWWQFIVEAVEEKLGTDLDGVQ